MLIVVIGGGGLIGTKLVEALRRRGHSALAASPRTGVNTLTGEGLAQSLEGADVVADVSNVRTFGDESALDYFETASRNLLGAAVAAHVRHHVALSVVGADRLPASAYLRAKVAQENQIKASSVPHTIVRSTQFFEFMGRIAQSSADGRTLRAAPVCVQPIASDEVIAALTDFALSHPRNETIEVAGPERLRLDEATRRFLCLSGETREVITDPHARYFGAELADGALLPSDEAIIGAVRFDDWLRRTLSP